MTPYPRPSALVGASPAQDGPRRHSASLKPLVAALALVTVAATLPGHPVSADTIPDLPDPAPAVALTDQDRPHAVDGVLYWRDHRLASLCAEVGGTFLKLPGSSVYACHARRLAGMRDAEEIER